MQYEIRKFCEVFCRSDIKNCGYTDGVIRCMSDSGYCLYANGKRVAMQKNGGKMSECHQDQQTLFGEF